MCFSNLLADVMLVVSAKICSSLFKEKQPYQVEVYMHTKFLTRLMCEGR